MYVKKNNNFMYYDNIYNTYTQYIHNKITLINNIINE